MLRSAEKCLRSLALPETESDNITTTNRRQTDHHLRRDIIAAPAISRTEYDADFGYGSRQRFGGGWCRAVACPNTGRHST
jgi:hypothetical protein